jgi:signal transduction histidine kinase
LATIAEQIRAQSLDVTLGKTINKVIHDLRKPFTNMRLSLDMLCEPGIARPSVEKIQILMTGNINYAEGIINELLEVKRQDTLRLSKISVKDFASHLQELFIDNLSAKGFRTEITFDCSGHLYCDLNKILAVLQNIINNAEEALQKIENEKRIKISCSELQKTDGKGFLCIQISNNGPAIPNLILNQLFINEITFGKANGTGLGLFACRKIIENHGGHISVRNLLFNSGVEFRIELPKKDEFKMAPPKAKASNLVP